MPKWVEFVGFQAAWLACVLGAGNERAWIGCAAAAVFVVAVAWPSESRGRAILAACAAGAVGSAADVLARERGWIVYRGEALAGVWTPLWIVALWIAFAATLSSSLGWLRGRAWLSVPFAAIGAPLSYAGAARTGAVELGAPLWPALAGVSASWIAAFHTAQWIEARLRVRGTHARRALRADEVR
jgi:hypothetical protein